MGLYSDHEKWIAAIRTDSAPNTFVWCPLPIKSSSMTTSPALRVTFFPSPASNSHIPDMRTSHCRTGVGCQSPYYPMGNSRKIELSADAIIEVFMDGAGGA